MRAGTVKHTRSKYTRGASFRALPLDVVAPVTFRVMTSTQGEPKALVRLFSWSSSDISVELALKAVPKSMKGRVWVERADQPASLPRLAL